MNAKTYNPKELLNILNNMEQSLIEGTNQYCPDGEVSFEDDPDMALKSFLSCRDVKGNEVGFISTQLALMQLNRELKKAKAVLVDTNDLRAVDDFISWKKQGSQTALSIAAPRYMPSWKVFIYALVSLGLLGVIVACCLFLFR